MILRAAVRPLKRKLTLRDSFCGGERRSDYQLIISPKLPMPKTGSIV
jgi:hypothetical protein